jgi:hypothetical protein
MAAVDSISDARAILGDDVLGPEEVDAGFGPAPTAAAQAAVPFTRAELVAARAADKMLVLRVTQLRDGRPLTLLHLAERFPAAFDQKLLRQMGYQLKDDWGITHEPLAATDTCAPGWALVRKEILDRSRNLPYDAQEAALADHAHAIGVPHVAVRRRSGVEAVYDTLLYFLTRNVRLLAHTWDWSSSRTLDGGYLNVGGFGAGGMQILSFSRAVRHRGLGICPTWQKD